MSYNAHVARLGEGKWHVVRAAGTDVKYTACSIELRPFKSSLRTVEVESKNGEPTCKHCIRWVKQDDERWRLAGKEARERGLPRRK